MSGKAEVCRGEWERMEAPQSHKIPRGTQQVKGWGGEDDTSGFTHYSAIHVPGGVTVGWQQQMRSFEASAVRPRFCSLIVRGCVGLESLKMFLPKPDYYLSGWHEAVPTAGPQFCQPSPAPHMAK